MSASDHASLPPSPSTASPLLPVAAYVRMSTEHQQYSTENQMDRIKEYADRRGMAVARVFADEGKSGLQVRGRDSLQRLIAEVESGQAEFRAILVYDVSRWGRFQDADESGYYEYICKRAGITVHYCAEQFENDGSPTSNIIKSVKRSMAGEYSRELSTKVFQGACRLIQLGFTQGGTAAFGLRRMLIDAAGRPKGVLGHGEQKSLATDRVIIVPGPESEQVVVREIFEGFVHRGQTERLLAAEMNRRQIPGWGRWLPSRVRAILSNEKYIGNLIYHKTSFKLQRRYVVNPPEMWIRADGAIPPIVDSALFAQAQHLLRERNFEYSEAQLLEALRACLARHGRISGPLIDREPGMPSSAVYTYHFGSLLRVYQRIGLDVTRPLALMAARQKEKSCRQELITVLLEALVVRGLQVEHDTTRNVVRVADEWTVAILVTRCRPTKSHQETWALQTHPQADLTVTVRLRPDNLSIHDYFIFPAIDRPSAVSLRQRNHLLLEAYRFGNLDLLLSLAARVSVEEAA